MAAYRHSIHNIDEVISKLTCRIARFHHSIPTLEDHKSLLKSYDRFIFILDENGFINAIDCKKKIGLCLQISPTQSNCKFISFSFDAKQSVLYCCDSNNNILVHTYCVKAGIFSLSYEKSFDLLSRSLANAGVEDVDEIEVLYSVDNNILLLVNKKFFIVEQIKESEACIATILACGTEHTMFYIVSDTFVLLQGDQMSSFNISHKSVLWRIDLKPIGVDWKIVQAWAVSPDLNSVVFINNDILIHVKIKEYIEAYPNCLLEIGSNVNFTKYSNNDIIYTSYVGDQLWKDKLSNLNKNKNKRSEPWYKRLFDKSSGPSSVNKKISGFDKAKENISQTLSSSFEVRYYLPKDMENVKARQMALNSETVSIVFEMPESPTVYIIDLSRREFYKQNLSTEKKIILSKKPDFPHVILTKLYLIYLVPKGETQEELVSKLMLYGGASSADHLCHLNKWERGSIPIPALEVGLKHRQLDTVAFFLKSKEKLFSAASHQPPVSPSSNVDETVLWQHSYNHFTNLKNLEPALLLLVDTVRDCSSDSQSYTFTHNLLSLTLNFLYENLHDGLNVSRSLGSSADDDKEREDLEKALDLLMNLIAELRCCLKLVNSKSPYRQISNVSSSVKSSMDCEDVIEDMDGKQNLDKSIEEATEAAVSDNELPKLQHNLLSRGIDASYKNLIQLGINTAIGHLLQHDTTQARPIILQLGFNYIEKLWEIVLSVKDYNLQQFILKELDNSDEITESQKELIQFIQRVYQSYPQHSFTQAFLIRSSSQRVQWSESHASKSKVSKYDLASECGNIFTSAAETELVSGVYSEFLVGWLNYWDDETKERVLLETEILKPSFRMEEYRNQKLLWKYVLSHNLKTESLLLLNLLLKQLKRSSEDQQQSVIEWLWQSLKHAGSYLKFVITIELMRQGYFAETVNSEFMLALEDITKVGGAIQKPHPLIGIHDLDLFHLNFVNFCTNQQLVLPLWRYCHVHGLKPENVHIENTSMQRWFDYFCRLFTVSQTLSCPEAIFEASLSSASFVWTSDLGLADLMVQGHVLAAIATLPFSSVPLHQVSEDGGLLSDIDRQVLETALKPYPKLSSALVPANHEDLQCDINVYQLLKENAPFDVRRLFGWQTSNTLASGDCRKILPYFSQPELVSQYAHTQKLQFTFYLKQGRPCYAFLSFLAEELAQGNSTLSSKRIQLACGVSLWIAVKYFNQPNIASSCVAFVDMLGQDSITIRAYLHVASTILTHKNSGLVGNIEKNKINIKNNQEEIISLLQASIRKRRGYSPQVLVLLEEAISELINKENILRCSFEAADKWLLAVIFCHLQHLPLSTRFLEDCAQADKWLPFVWFAQIHQFPRQQLQGLLHQFRSRHLRDHLHYVIENADLKSLASPLEKSLPKDGKNSGSKDVRYSLYSRIGVTKDTESSSGEEPEINLPPSLESLVKLEQEVPTVTVESAADDVFGVVFDAQNTPSPWKSLLSHAVILNNPLCAELAVCENDKAVIPCLCGWLVAMMDVSEHKKFLVNYCNAAYKWSMKELECLIDVHLKKNWMFTLSTAFDIFKPESPLLYFLKFAAEFIHRKDHEMCKMYLGDFKEAMLSYAQQKAREDVTLIDDSLWLEQTVYKIILHYLTTLHSSYLLLLFLKLLDHENIALAFSFDVPDFGKLHKVSEILHLNGINLGKFSDLLNSNNSAYETTCQSAVSQMIEKKSFVDAKRFCKLAKINGDRITLAQLQNDKTTLISSDIWISRVARTNYWKHCSSCLKNHEDISLQTITAFFQNEADEVEDEGERALIYELCFKNVEELGSGGDVEILDEYYKKKWMCRIKHHIQKSYSQQTDEPLDEILSSLQAESSATKLAEKSELLHYGRMPSVIAENKKCKLNKEEKEALEELISGLLMNGYIIESCRVAAVFSHYSQDLAIILTCIRLSIGSIGVEQIDPVLKKLLTEFKPRKSVTTSMSMSSSVSLISLSSTTSMWSNLPVEKEKIIETMERLLGHCIKGQQCGLRVLTAFKVSSILEVPYQDVVISNEFDVLRDLLKTDYNARFILAKDFLGTSSLTDNEVAGFLSDSILQTLQYDDGDDEENIEQESTGRRMLLNSGGAEQYIKLCQDPSILGDRLLQAVSNDTGEISHNTMSLQTELLVLAHDCHTIACNMEGISHVLRAARLLTENLARSQEFTLMIRLLTGVGRFSEMTYIFDALKVNHQFEMLLRKGIEKEDKLKTAILDYLTRFHPSDNDSYTMVALNFMMYREIAKMLEERGKKCLKSLKEKQLENTKEIHDILKESAQYFADAAERYVKENCVRHAQQCIRRARLVALQIQLLPSGVTVVNLSNEELVELMAHHPKFLDTLIISEAYGKRCDWSEAIYHNVIINGDFRYLQDLKSHVQLKPVLVSDAIERYQSSVQKPVGDQVLLNIKKLLTYCKDVKLQYKLAEEFNFKDIITQMLKGDSGSYLQDIIAMS